ncbi:Glycine cleavage system H protein [Candidatus Bilamarchaeum dharawalense]|uniref:Probable glycine cleavage system H protein n=1 Tax=Candidatus Bilamarchaeum dharawalense TaxID=2885759 RepID=A0A5E4LQH0_9ARCH|nr:Glycine cleavage system H protein [Candidatus Bilamarchaeum dharawalense]
MTNIPKDLLYTKEHEWIRVEGDVGVVGITDYAQHALTDIVFVELPAQGKKIDQSKGLTVVESVKSVSDVYAPVAGEVVEANSSLKANPELVNHDPYGKGWIAKLKISSKDQLKTLMGPEQYEKYLQEQKH